MEEVLANQRREFVGVISLVTERRLVYHTDTIFGRAENKSLSAVREDCGEHKVFGMERMRTENRRNENVATNK